jgi:inhibitor of KinA sporulation pathway (predicted exonuclease)
MTSLEFIEKEIEKEQTIIKTYEEYFKTDKTELDKQITRGYIQIHQKNIDHLNHIKTILEAWEVVKPYVDIIDKDTPYPFWQLKPNYDECKLKETNILIKAKALEVEE